jgi:predicted transposase YbfD/YdcC
MLVVSFLAVLCGAEGCDDIRDFGEAKRDWLKGRLGLSLDGGIPSDDTFRRLFARLDPVAFGRCFRSWVETLQEQSKGEVIALDGKMLRHSFDTASGRGALHLVRAWAARQRLVLGAVRVAEGSNEIPAVSALVSLLDLRGAIVTADAMHCQRATAAQIVEQDGDYVLSVKGNQSFLAEDIALCFAHLKRHPAAPREWKEAVPGRAVSAHAVTDYGHGRTETRTAQALTLPEDDPHWRMRQNEWKGLRCLMKVERTRCIGEKESRETQYFISSLAAPAKKLASAVRQHWQIENSLHWVLDVQMREDESRIRVDHGPENFALLRSVALNLLRRDKNSGRGVRARQKLAGWDNDYLVKLLA